MKRLLYILFCLIVGCSSSETIIKDRRIEITVPEIKDSLPVTYKEIPKSLADTLENIFSQLSDSSRIEGEKEIMTSKGKVKANVKYYPKKKFIELDIKEHKIDTIITDTTNIVEKKQTTTTEKIGYATIGIIAFVFLLIIIFLTIKLNLIKL